MPTPSEMPITKPQPAAPHPTHTHTHTPLPDLRATEAARSLFWHNVVREMLTSLSMMQMQGSSPQLFDGRIQVMTHGGERIPIGVVFPLFACSIPGTGKEHEASMAVECTVFRIQTPGGEVFTLPVHEIRGLASLTDELIKQLEQASMSRTRPESEAPGPFGFAAFVPSTGDENDEKKEKAATPGTPNPNGHGPSPGRGARN